jgi:Raf kinase inhibitor-like YbhB/YbcL family protein
MSQPRQTLALVAGLLAAALARNATALELSSPDISDGATLNAAQVYSGFGCSGGNQSPELHWQDAPAGTQSFALTVYDPDAPTGSGWWHWTLYDIPASSNQLPRGANAKTLPAGSQQGRNDYGSQNFGGACPPAGSPAHHYVFTLHALKVAHLEAPPGASAALLGYLINSNRLASATLTPLYGR